MTSLDDFATTEHLLPKALQVYGKPRCSHPQTLVVQHYGPFGWFVCRQCCHCGVITQEAVTADELNRGNDLPWLDVSLYEQATTERLPGETIVNTLAFFAEAMR